MTMEKAIQIDQVIEKHKASGKFFQVDGMQAFALDYGSGEPVFCIHGVPTSSFLYRKVLTSLSDKGFRGICVDLPGLGFTDRPVDYNYSFFSFSRFLDKATTALGIDKYHLVVHDIGGPIGFALADANMEKILSLTILNTWIDVVKFQKPLPMRPFEKPILGEAELKMITHTTWPIMFNKMGVKNHDGIPSAEIKAYVDLLKREDGGKAFLKIMRNFDKTPQFREICYKAVQQKFYPVQVIWGEDDPALKYERYGVEVKEAAGLDEVYKLPSKHFLQEEFPNEIAEKITELIDHTHTSNVFKR